MIRIFASYIGISHNLSCCFADPNNKIYIKLDCFPLIWRAFQFPIFTSTDLSLKIVNMSPLVVIFAILLVITSTISFIRCSENIKAVTGAAVEAWSSHPRNNRSDNTFQSSGNCAQLELTPPLLAPFPGCECPKGYALYVDFDTNASSCVKTCFGVSTVICNNAPLGSIGQCLGTSLPLITCDMSTAFRNLACAGCGNLLIFPDGTFYCVSYAQADIDSTCPAGYAPLCSLVASSVSCQNTPANLNLRLLYQQFSCKDCDNNC